MTTQKRAALYVRVSTDLQTVENQTLRLHEAAKFKGWGIVETFSDQCRPTPSVRCADGLVAGSPWPFHPRCPKDQRDAARIRPGALSRSGADRHCNRPRPGL